MVLESKTDKSLEKIKLEVESLLAKLNTGEIAERDDIILCHWGSGMLQLSVSDLDSIDRVVALSQWASLAFVQKTRRDQAKCFLCKFKTLKSKTQT